MLKRERPYDSALSQPGHVKRPRIQQQQPAEEPIEEIISSRHLQDILYFDQNIDRAIKTIRIFKSFLDSILYSQDQHDVPRKRAILLEYLESQKPREIDEETVFLPNFMQTWSFAATANSDKLSSATTSILALLVKVLSNHIDFREYGLLLCKTILQQSQLRLLARGLSASKSKEYVIAPCIRLLTELVVYDGGTLARQVYAKRDLTFDTRILARNLALRKMQSQEAEDIKRKPSVRTTAIRYLLASFKFQNEGAKADMLKQANVMRALIDGIELDPSPIIREIVYSLTTYVINDPAVPRRNKSYVFNDRNLYSLCQLYRVDLAEEGTLEDRKPLMEVVHEMMVTVCTSSEVGVVKQSGWYPPNEDDVPIEEPAAATGTIIDLGLDALDWDSKFMSNIPIRNWSLGEFILTLRPYAFDLERQLLNSIFEAAPELVAWFFVKIAPNFTFTPKLTATWIGYAAFVYSAVQLPIPHLYNRMSHLPPPVPIVIESILPRPLTQKVLRQCTSNSSDLIKFFAVRIITVAFQKLRDVIAMFRDNSKNGGKLWEQAIEKLVAEFGRRCPAMKEITMLYSTLKNSTAESHMQREAVARLICLYYEVTPQVALDEKFDVSVPLASALQNVEEDMGTLDEKELRLLELSHLVKIAHWSPSMSWWSKPKALKFSPFMTLLRLLVRAPESSTEIKPLVASIIKDCGALQTETEIPALDALIISLADGPDFAASDATLQFLDDCFKRVSQKPIKYEDDKDALLRSNAKMSDGPISLLRMTLLEQSPFFEKELPEHVANFHIWSDRLRIVLAAIGEPDVTGSSKSAKVTTFATPDQATSIQTSIAELKIMAKNSEVEKPAQVTVIETAPETTAITPLNLTPFLPPLEDTKNTALMKWSRKDIVAAVEEGDIASLIMNLTSPHHSIRIQTLTALRTFINQLQLPSCTYPEKEQLYILLSELLETAQPILEAGKQFSGLATCWAGMAVGVVSEPTSVMYPKVCDFLMLRPKWRVSKMAEYWTEKIILKSPEDENEGAYYRELIWLLNWLYEGLRTEADVDTLRKTTVLEKVFATFLSPALGNGNGAKVFELVQDGPRLEREASLQGKIRPLVLRIVCRIVAVGGATTLVTRTGILAWLGEVKSMSWVGEEGIVFLEGLKNVIVEKADIVRVGEWSGGTI
ncbi:ribosome biogenesis protein urb1 [Venturia nashicola]|uniref:Ribosome biogenesis protein urb1 n=1 Tax=Venturia nashicola TaxID=86259 RepID=A0A4Z1PRB9_9PEZI|nr:ribosome biogenesis protein urb1 [Venturia nashicola]